MKCALRKIKYYDGMMVDYFVEMSVESNTLESKTGQCDENCLEKSQTERLKVIDVRKRIFNFWPG